MICVLGVCGVCIVYTACAVNTRQECTVCACYVCMHVHRDICLCIGVEHMH